MPCPALPHVQHPPQLRVAAPQRFEFRFDGAGGGLRYKYDLTLNLEGTTLCDATPRPANAEPASGRTP